MLAHVLGLCLACIAIVEARGLNGVFHMEQSKPSLSDKASCDVHDYNSRFDCDPALVSSQSHCESKGCCWRPAASHSLKEPNRKTNIPYCYFPRDYDHYHVTDTNPRELGFTANLVRQSHSGWPNDIMKLKLDVMFETDTRLHFKIYDPNNKRYEVPIDTPIVTKKASNPNYDVVLQKSPFGLKVTRKATGAVMFDSTMAGAPLIFADQFIQMSTHTGNGLVYGLGEHMAPLLFNGTWQQLSLWNRDAGPQFDANLYGSHPFYMNAESDGKAHGVFLLNSNAMDIDLQPLPALTFRTIGGILDLYIMSGPSPDVVIQQYTDIVGRPYMPPYWAFGFHLCRYGYNSSDYLKTIIDRNRAIGIPYDVQWTDIDYMDKYRDWMYDKDKFAGLPDIVNDLHQHGQRYVIIVDPGISNMYPGKYPPYDEGMKDDIFIKDNITHQPIVGMVWPGPTVFPDFTHPKAEDWWFRQANAFHKQLEFDGLWIDMNEPSNALYGSTRACTNNTYDVPPYVPGLMDGSKLPTRTLCPSAQQYLSSHYNLHNMYGLHETRATHNALKKVLKKRSIVISRSSFPSQGYYGGHWTGDIRATWQHLKYTIPAMLRFNMFGVPLIGADVCGFGGDTTEELCTRWMQLGAFYPFMRNHNSLGNKDQDPAAFSPSAQHAMRLILDLRYLLLPYLNTLFYHSHVTGSTVARPLFFNFPSEPATYGIDSQFMWGDALLISPVLQQGATSVSAYLPKVMWYNMFTNTPIQGEGRYVTLNTPLNVTNVHVRAGRILPLQKPATTTTQSRQQPFYLFVALDVDNTACGDLFWDDGDRLDSYEDGVYNLIEFSATNGELSSSVTKYGYKTTMTLSSIAIFGVHQKPESVTIYGEPVAFSYQNNEILLINGVSVDMTKPFSALWK